MAQIGHTTIMIADTTAKRLSDVVPNAIGGFGRPISLDPAQSEALQCDRTTVDATHTFIHRAKFSHKPLTTGLAFDRSQHRPVYPFSPARESGIKARTLQLL